MFVKHPSFFYFFITCLIILTSLGYDCVMIPGATKASNKSPVPNSICGNGKGLVTLAAGTTSATVCSKCVCLKYSKTEHNVLSDLIVK